MAKKNELLDEEIIDLTELIEPGTTGGKAAAAYAKAAATPPPDLDDDFGALLADAAPPAQDAAHKVDPHESLDMSSMGGIDNLLESLDIPPQPRDRGAPSAPEPDPDDLDSVLDDLLMPAEPPKKEPPKKEAPAPQPVADNDDFDLDSLLADTPQGSTSPQPADRSELDADLDDILASFDEPAQPKDVPEQPAETEPSAAVQDSLPELETAPDSTEADVAEATAQESAQDDAIPPATEMIAPPSHEEKSQPANPPLAQDTADVADLLDDLDSTLEDEPLAEKAAAAGCESPQDVGDTPEDLLGDMDDAGQAPITQMPAHSRSVLPAEMPEKDETARQHLPIQAVPADVLTGICQSIASAKMTGDREALQGFSRELGAQSAHVQDLGSQLTQLGKRLLACESKVAAARARISGLEKGMEAAAAFEDLLREGTPLHAGFLALISTAVTNALQGFPPPTSQDDALSALEARINAFMENTENRLGQLEQSLEGIKSGEAERVEKMEAQIWDVDSRLEELEKKVEELKQSFGDQMEKAASATVARVLQEEIGKLLQE